MEDAVRPRRSDQLFDGTGIGELAVEERDATLVRLVSLTCARRVATFDDVEDALRHERVEVLHPRAPPIGAEDGDIGVLGEDVLSEVASGETGDTGDKDAHRARTLARVVPGIGWLACATAGNALYGYALDAPPDDGFLLLGSACGYDRDPPPR